MFFFLGGHDIRVLALELLFCAALDLELEGWGGRGSAAYILFQNKGVCLYL